MRFGYSDRIVNLEDACLLGAREDSYQGDSFVWVDRRTGVAYSVEEGTGGIEDDELSPWREMAPRKSKGGEAVRDTEAMGLLREWMEAAHCYPPADDGGDWCGNDGDCLRCATRTLLAATEAQEMAKP